MKNKFKLFTVGLGILLLPIVNVNAANYKIEGTTNENTATYEIKYVTDSMAPETSQVTFKITKEDNMYSYSIKKGNTVGGDCYDSDLSCTVGTVDGSALAEGTVLATLTVTNNTSEAVASTILVSGYDATRTNVVLPGKEETTTKPKSSDATLSEISVSLGTMDQPFSKDISTYNVTGLKDTINAVRVTPDCDNNCSWKLVCPNGDCTISNSTTVNLKKGANQVSIIVESEDGTLTKSYVLNIYRGDIELNSPYLSKISTKNGTLSPTFDSKVNDYTIVVGLDIDKLDLEAIPEDPSANVLIKGNENLKEGENTVTITVTSKDGQNKQVYTIIVTKEDLKEETEKEEIKEEKEEVKINKVDKKKDNTLLIIILSIIGLGLIIGAYFIIFKIKKNKNKNKKDDKNNKNDKNNSSKTEKNENEAIEEELAKEEEKTTKEKIDEITKELIIPNIDDEPKQDVDEALDDLMKTKKLELGDLDF